jgi:hypothetical protein
MWRSVMLKSNCITECLNQLNHAAMVAYNMALELRERFGKDVPFDAIQACNMELAGYDINYLGEYSDKQAEWSRISFIARIKSNGTIFRGNHRDCPSDRVDYHKY